MSIQVSSAVALSSALVVGALAVGPAPAAATTIDDAPVETDSVRLLQLSTTGSTVEATDPSEPVPGDPVVEPTDDAVDPGDGTDDGGDPGSTTDPIGGDPIDTEDPGDPEEPIDTGEPVEPEEPIGIEEPVEPEDPTEPAPSDPVDGDDDVAEPVVPQEPGHVVLEPAPAPAASPAPPGGGIGEVPSGTPVEAPAAPASPTERDPNLPETGADGALITMALGAGLVLVAAGGALLVRRRADDAS